MKKIVCLFVIVSFLSVSFKTDIPAYLIYKKGGKKTSFAKMMKELKEADVILFGELHNEAICHWLQLETAKALYEEKMDKLFIGMEMFERDDQLLMNEYLKACISESSFEKEAKIWPNYRTDYKPVVQFAKEKSIPVIASNIPRRYASVVYTKGLEGLDSLDEQAYHYIAPLPIRYDPNLSSYKEMMSMMGTMGGKSTHAGNNLPKAQAIKDATMAYSILEVWSPGDIFLHLNGTFHSEKYEGIYWYLKQDNPDLKIITIATVNELNIEEPDEKKLGLADYIICIPANMTKTH